ncbi:MAG: serine acetyltransferase [Muribaculaceae bacterium]|nr:serine acetyltransferase [Muribaculaceae bacterium]
MILSKTDLKRFLDSDRKALNISRNKPRLFGDEIWRYQIALRKFEYYTNVKCFWGWILRTYWHLQHKIWGVRLGFTIPVNVVDEGLCLYHYGCVVISKYAKVGKWCKIHAGVNIGQNWTADESPVIGDNCFLSPGAKLFGQIRIGNNVVVGANAVVNRSFESDNITIAGVPAKIVKHSGSPSFEYKDS